MKLWEMTRLIRSKNAGPFELTFAIIFKDTAGYTKVSDAELINTNWVAKTYGVAESSVKVINYPAAKAIKVTIPRPVISGDLHDSDVYGGQQHGPFVELEVQ
jgi:hypothetical protein